MTADAPTSGATASGATASGATGGQAQGGLGGSGASADTPSAGQSSGGTSSAGTVDVGDAGTAGESTSADAGAGGVPTSEGGAPSVEPEAGAPSAGSGGDDSAGDNCDADEVCDGLDNDCNGDIDEGGACPDGCVGFELDGHGYMFCDDVVGQNAALRLCEEQGMRLPYIETEDEQNGLEDALADILDNSGGMRPGSGGGFFSGSGTYPGIGGSSGDTAVWLYARDQQEGTWRWVGDAGFVFYEEGRFGNQGQDGYENWATGEPDDGGLLDLLGEDCAVMLVTDVGSDDAGEWQDVSCQDEYLVLCETPD